MARDTYEIPPWMRNHIDTYIATKGQVGHFYDLSQFGGGTQVPTLLLRTIGRKSGKVSTLPLIYGRHHNDYVIVASNAGADHHPAWFLNIEAMKTANIQVGGAAFEASWRVAAGEERQKILAYMIDLYPPYKDFCLATSREIPFVILHPERTIQLFTP